MKNIYLYLIIFFTCSSVIAQEKPFYENYDWNVKPTYDLQETKDQPMLGLKHKVAIEFAFLEDNSFVEYYLQHKAYLLNSDDKIEEYNKIYLPYSSSSELIANKARVINGNKIIELDENDILTAENEETGDKYKYFALKGVQKGSIVEFFYIVKKYPSYKGVRAFFQDDYDVKNIEFDLYSPENLIFDIKSFNGLKEAQYDENFSDENRNHWSMQAENITALEEEDNSAHNANRKFLIYKLDKNLANNSSGISSYDIVVQNLMPFFYPKETSKKTDKQLEKYINKIGVDKASSNKEKIQKIENFLKTNIFVTDVYNDKLEDLEYIMSESVASNRGITKLYISLFNLLDIKHEIVITSDRTELSFDQSYEATVFLNEFLIYFPEDDLYLDPTEIGSRLGYPPTEVTDNYGLFIKTVKVGSYSSGVGEVKYIDAVTSDKNYDNMHVKASFNKENLNEVNISLKREMFGYYASFVQPYAHLIKKESEKDFVQAMVENLDEGIQVDTYKLENFDSNLYGVKPLRIIVEVNSEAFVEKAGNKYLFNVGGLIGKQTELYQDKERKQALDNGFMRRYDRELIIELPAEMKVANLNDINIDQKFTKDGEELMAFKSRYKLEGNTLTIYCNEHYSINKLPASDYADYRRVINAAADFNKVTLVLEPK
ncbi:DUF3857 domain-containing protein [Mesonia sp. K7]|uniref:DUF3857 domain-containing protein n=1 Tax=Mesonia sp. K7 TaxID=2218606 RepID=UPI000DA6EC9D|nr:DUF3857 domain-containing protein [Mesonia sp. K7]PZD78687.1 hypothetical protein DNG35_04340 [Mesonia sp. K7]